MFNRQGWKRANLLRQFVVFSIATLILLMSTGIDRPIALGQLPSLTAPSGTQPLPVGVRRQGSLESAGVHLDGKELFRIASPTVLNRSELGSQIPVEVRAKYIEANLQNLITGNRFSDETVLDPKTLEVAVETINGQPVLFVKDATQTEAKVLLTVTEADAQYASISKERLAERWKEILERELRQALELRQPKALQRQIFTVVKVLVTAVLLTLVLGATWVLLKRREQRLEQRLAAESASIYTQELTPVEPSHAESELQLFQRLRHHFGLQRRQQIILFLRWLLFWALAFVWVTGIAYSLNAFPQTRQFAKRVVAIPIVMLMTWFLTGLVNRLTDFGIDRFIQSWQQDKSLTKANLQRIATVTNVVKGLKKGSDLHGGYPLGTPVAALSVRIHPDIGALLALVVSLAVQSLVQDFVNGFLILLEDHFRIGDNIRIDSISGMVENLNLRVTQIRSDEGNLITLPNRLITQVENRSRSWARADFRVEVAYHTDVDRALAIVRKTVDQMAQAPEWQSVILDTHELFGVDQISHTGIVIRLWIKTAPLQQWATARELRRRLKIAFDRNNIQIGTPQHVQLENGYNKSGTIEHSQTIE